MTKASRAYKATLLEGLKDPKEAAEYLNAALEEIEPELFLLALRISFFHSFIPLPITFSPFTTPLIRGAAGQGANAPPRKWMRYA